MNIRIACIEKWQWTKRGERDKKKIDTAIKLNVYWFIVELIQKISHNNSFGLCQHMGQEFRWFWCIGKWTIGIKTGMESTCFTICMIAKEHFFRSFKALELPCERDPNVFNRFQLWWKMIQSLPLDWEWNCLSPFVRLSTIWMQFTCPKFQWNPLQFLYIHWI